MTSKPSTVYVTSLSSEKSQVHYHHPQTGQNLLRNSLSFSLKKIMKIMKALEPSDPSQINTDYIESDFQTKSRFRDFMPVFSEDIV